MTTAEFAPFGRCVQVTRRLNKVSLGIPRLGFPSQKAGALFKAQLLVVVYGERRVFRGSQFNGRSDGDGSGRAQQPLRSAAPLPAGELSSRGFAWLKQSLSGHLLPIVRRFQIVSTT